MIKLSRLTYAEIDDLARNFGISSPSEEHSGNAYISMDLLDETRCAAYLDEWTKLYRSPSRKVTASLFSKRYAFLVIVPRLYAMTMFNKGFELPLEECYLETASNQIWLPGNAMTALRASEPRTGNREQWREELLQRLFYDHIAKVWRTLSKVASIPMPILWENAAVRVFSLYEKRISGIAANNNEVRLRLQEDYDYLIRRASGSLFGEADNPFMRFYGEGSLKGCSDSPVRVRKTCCFYYMVPSDEGYCSNCPRNGS
ncbi:IucA/IucC family C-terminal-domain containing protein [Cohnella cholangitidis]|uniref:Fe-S protein n=1 Tax=Cohnella cholangitidis TaxID=2598458 RepID=A0A7G5C6J5_9BACL|nr:IucA/IucC family C-terminal-domain containing protein [Cohnella cholangitidis]QMV44829.1 Fe-S protein [Cohnella cholangitidis]